MIAVGFNRRELKSTFRALAKKIEAAICFKSHRALEPGRDILTLLKVFNMRRDQISQQLNVDYQLTTSQKAELDERYDNHLQGIGTTHSWEETVAMQNRFRKNEKDNRSSKS